MIKKKVKKKSIRLTPDIKPKRYTITLKPDLESLTFSGKEIIDITIGVNTKTITLHSKDIKIETVEIQCGREVQFAQKISYSIDTETVTFTFRQPIKKGRAKLFLIFNGIINDNLRGFYRSRYVVNGKDKTLATTQFESTDARRAFPCFDEPAKKAIFDVSLIIPGNHTAISNTLPISIEEHEVGYKIVEFASTPRMSTYLLAFIIGEFECIEGYTKDKVHVRVFTTRGKKHQAKFALEVAIKSLEFYNTYFNIPYPLPVLDLIAIPDFESAAMENWGAITFRETAILVDEEHTSLANKQWVAIVIAHEIAHQWFGNLVTMEWWTDLWLNEGFASYMENFCVNAIFPEWHIWDLYIADRYSVALKLDALANSHPIEVTVNHPNEISEIFDMVSYAKGSAVIRMLAEYIGHDHFRNGLRHYLKKHSYKNTNTVDLWESFEKVSKKPVKKIMETWTKKTGYPLISLSKTRKGFQVHQERFFSSRLSAKNNKEKTLWHVPLKYKSNNDVIPLLATKKSVPLIGTTIGKLNTGEGSFVRTQYDTQTLKKLSEEVKNKTLPVADRLGIIRDLFALAEGGYISTIEALEFSLSYKDETEYIVWSELATGLYRVYNLISGEKWKNRYEIYARSLFSPLAEQMTFEKKMNEKHSDTFLRNLALGHSASYGDKNTIKKARELFVHRHKKSIPADIRSVIYGIVASYGSKKEWHEFENLYLHEHLHEEKDRYGRALTQYRDKALLQKTLDFALSDKVRTQDAPFMMAGVWANSISRDLTWKFMKKNWTLILKRYGEGGFISRLLPALGNHTKIKDAVDAKKFFAQQSAPGADRTLEQVYERIYSNAAWLQSDKTAIKKWLEKNF